MYTCKGGFIDLGHVREGADRAAYLAKITKQNLTKNQKQFSFQIIEPSKYWVKITYPSNWNKISPQQKGKIIDDMSANLGQYLAHKTLIWHEIITWYGFATIVLFPDTPSAFSWEDPYSDVIGTSIGIQAWRNPTPSYDQAVTRILRETLRELDVQPAEVCRHAAKWVDGRWYTGGMYFFIDMKIRNYDIGLQNGKITPWLVPGMCPDATPYGWPVPGPDVLTRHGFKIKVEMEARAKSVRIHESIGLDKSTLINPEIHFPMIMGYIQTHKPGNHPNHPKSGETKWANRDF
jgi:hypothetical protein